MSFICKVEARYKIVSTTVDQKHYIDKGIFKKIADKYGLVDFSGEDNKDFIWLARIYLPEEKQGQGIGSTAMKELINYADKNGKRIYLSPSKLSTETNVNRLRRFYKKFGFKKNERKSAHRNFGYEELRREPKQL